MTLGILLVGLRDILPALLSIHLANSLVLLVPVLFAFSLRRFFAFYPSIWPMLLVYITGILSFFIVYSVAGMRERIISIMLFQAILYADLAIFLFRVTPRQVFLGSVFTGISMLSLFRAIVTYPETDMPAFHEHSGFHALYFLVSTALWFACVVSFLMILSQRLTHELSEERNSLSEALKIKKFFLRLVAHDLRNPVGNAISYLDLALDTENINFEEKEQYIRRAKQQTEYGLDLLNDLLSWSELREHRDKQDMKWLALNEVLLPEIKAAELNARKKNIQLELRIPPDSFIYGSSSSLRTALRNMIGNSIKFCSAGNIIEIYVDIHENCQISVLDNGPGMTQEQIDQANQGMRLSSTPGSQNEKGTGFGFLLCHEVATAHQGTFHVEPRQTGLKTTLTVPTTNKGDKNQLLLF